jgi:hypothetical protein
MFVLAVMVQLIGKHPCRLDICRQHVRISQ